MWGGEGGVVITGQGDLIDTFIYCNSDPNFRRIYPELDLFPNNLLADLNLRVCYSSAIFY